MKALTKSSPPEREILTPREVEALTGLSRNTVNQMFRRGDIPGRRITPRRWGITRTAFQKWLDQEETK